MATIPSIRGSPVESANARPERVADDEQRRIAAVRLKGVEAGNHVVAFADAMGVVGTEVEPHSCEPGRRQRREEGVDDVVEAVSAVQRVRVAQHRPADRWSVGWSGEVGDDNMTVGGGERYIGADHHRRIVADPRA